MNSTEKPRKKLVHRYTSLASALHVLRTSTLTLLSPDSWEDQNDRAFLRVYRERTKWKSVLALCLTSASETHHHWSIFAPGTDGVRLVLDRSNLIASVENDPSISWKKVQYRKISDLGENGPKIEELPFLKRYPYRQEEEERLLFRSVESDHEPYSLKLNARVVREVVLSPRLHPKLSDVIIQTVRDASDQKVKVYRSSLLQNDRWISYASR